MQKLQKLQIKIKRKIKKKNMFMKKKKSKALKKPLRINEAACAFLFYSSGAKSRITLPWSFVKKLSFFMLS